MSERQNYTHYRIYFEWPDDRKLCLTAKNHNETEYFIKIFILHGFSCILHNTCFPHSPQSPFINLYNFISIQSQSWLLRESACSNRNIDTVSLLQHNHWMNETEDSLMITNHPEFPVLFYLGYCASLKFYGDQFSHDINLRQFYETGRVHDKHLT